MNPNYLIERWPNGWLVCSVDCQSGVPIDALSEVLQMVGPDAILNASIPHHFRTTGKPVVFCLGDKSSIDLWCAEIEASLDGLPLETRWWQGLNVGTSSSAIFGVLAADSCTHKHEAAMSGRGSTPLDSDDLSRCLQLIRYFPEWKDRLPEVALAFPQTDWPAIIASWDQLAAASPKDQCRILSELKDSSKGARGAVIFS